MEASKVVSREKGKSPDKWCINICSWLRLLVIVSVIREVVSIIWTTDNCSNKQIRIGRARIQVLKPCATRYALRMGVDGWNGGASVVDMLWKPDPEANHLAAAPVEFRYFPYVNRRNVAVVTYCRLLSLALYRSPPVI